MADLEHMPERCPRCRGALIRNYDEALCLVHGTVYTPVRGWDLGSMNVPTGDNPEGRTGRRRPRAATTMSLHTCDRCGRRCRGLDLESHWMACVAGEPQAEGTVECAACDGTGDRRGIGRSHLACDVCRGLGAVLEGVR